MDIMVSATSGLNGICLTESWRQIRIVARQSMGKLAFGTASSLSGPGPVMLGIFLCRNLTVAATKTSPCSLILSVNHFSRLRYSLLLARIARSITKGKGCPFSIRERALRSWATSRIRDSLECSLSPSWAALWYQSAMLSIKIGLIWMLWLCQACAKITPELAWEERNTLKSLPNSSCLRRVMGGLICSNPSTKTSGQEFLGKVSSSATCIE